MATDTKVTNLVLNVLTEEQYAAAEKTENELYLIEGDDSHNQAADTITAGTFAGQVAANSLGQTADASCLRNSKLVSAETTPAVNGEIFWTYE